MLGVLKKIMNHLKSSINNQFITRAVHKNLVLHKKRRNIRKTNAKEDITLDRDSILVFLTSIEYLALPTCSKGASTNRGVSELCKGTSLWDSRR